MRLSIIIPYYNTLSYTNELLKVLDPQITDDVECVLIDDGSTVPFKSEYDWLTVIRKENGGPATARNAGINNSSGEYIAFIDSDDLVAEYYVKKILQKIAETNADVIDFSWKSLNREGTQFDYKLMHDQDFLKNPSVCTRVFKRSYIGNTRFNEKKGATEDEDFSRRMGYLKNGNFTHRSITDYMYFYRTTVRNSNVKSFKKGLTNTKRIVYYYPKVTKDMTWLRDEIKKEDEYNEVILLTNHCELTDLSRYCQIEKPHTTWGHYLRGEPYNRFVKVEIPIKTQVIFYCGQIDMISGISTFLYNTCQRLSKVYKIMVLYEYCDPVQKDRLARVVNIMKNNPDKAIVCDTIVLNRLTDKIPPNVTYGKSVQMCHACARNNISINPDRDFLVNVSEASKESWGKAAENGIVIHNMSWPEKKELMLVSATRVGASDKGSNDQRMKILANMLNEKGIPFVWLNFSDKPLSSPPRNFINMGARVNIQDFIRRADYLVQLSDKEAYSMSVLEALTLNTPVIATGFPSLFEEGFVDGVHGYAVPFDMKFDVKKLLKVPKFKFEYDNDAIVKRWVDLLDAPAPLVSERKVEGPEMVNVLVLRSFKDKHTGKMITKGYAAFPRQRVQEILEVQRIKKIRLIEVCAE